MAAVRVVMGPRCEVNVVGHNKRLAGFEPQYKPLMAASLVVIRQDLDDRSMSLDLQIAGTVFERCHEARFESLGYRGGRRTRRAPRPVRPSAFEFDESERGGGNDGDQNHQVLQVSEFHAFDLY